MSVENIKKLKAEKGFTIVELLIVIVVIGILAAIVIVAYNGITQRANTSKAQANATSVQKVAEAMNADGAYPTGLANLQAGSTSTKLPTGVLVNRPTTAGTTLANATTAADGSIPATTATNAFNTVAIFGTTGGGVIFYRDGAGAVNPIYYGAASASSSFSQFPA